MGRIKENIEDIIAKKEEITAKAGRNKDEVLLVAVTKTRTAEEINEAIDAGITHIGENKVQEIMDKFDQVKRVNWHMIGHLQTNKVKYIIDKVYMIHSVDSLKLAEEIDKRAGQSGIMMNILIQVNAAEEESKFGITTEETGMLIQEILKRCPHIKIKGLMCIAPFEDNPEEVRGYFRQVKELYEQFGSISHERLDFQYLSMGMSNDYEVAIQEGSNLIRVGTAIFGERNYSNK
ncbi:YggS family pyridoxal phosphate-dependent enzyme [Sinanaerobacter chloroacetimidivorans]|uniref:YggS family pyridoxal phosphate-dependent enzyme n=1 Tax=Sinanaerobacter chloroacetimidivorans TaxID=2818044 RepID=UPI001D05798D|nr:YggS family pyridoxal phosphate-dependent enzyme [Sinanaerobacter chloroacetimidivorans]